MDILRILTPHPTAETAFLPSAGSWNGSGTRPRLEVSQQSQIGTQELALRNWALRWNPKWNSWTEADMQWGGAKLIFSAWIAFWFTWSIMYLSSWRGLSHHPVSDSRREAEQHLPSGPTSLADFSLIFPAGTQTETGESSTQSDWLIR